MILCVCVCVCNCTRLDLLVTYPLCLGQLSEIVTLHHLMSRSINVHDNFYQAFSSINTASNGQRASVHK